MNLLSYARTISLLLLTLSACSQETAPPQTNVKQPPTAAAVATALTEDSNAKRLLQHLEQQGYRFNLAHARVAVGKGIAQRFFTYTATADARVDGLGSTLFALIGTRGQILAAGANQYGAGREPMVWSAQKGELVEQRPDHGLMSRAKLLHAVLPPMGLASGDANASAHTQQNVAGFWQAQTETETEQIGGFCDPVAAQYGTGAHQPDGTWLPGSCSACQTAVKACYNFAHTLDFPELAFIAWDRTERKYFFTEDAPEDTFGLLDSLGEGIAAATDERTRENLRECWYSQPEILEETCDDSVWADCAFKARGICESSAACTQNCLNPDGNSAYSRRLNDCRASGEYWAAAEADGVEGEVWTQICESELTALQRVDPAYQGDCQTVDGVLKVLRTTDAHLESRGTPRATDVAGELDGHSMAFCREQADIALTQCAYARDDLKLGDLQACHRRSNSDQPLSEGELTRCTGWREHCLFYHFDVLKTVIATHANLVSLRQISNPSDGDFEHYCAGGLGAAESLATTSGCGLLPECLPMSPDGTVNSSVTGTCGCNVSSKTDKDTSITTYDLSVTGNPNCTCPQGMLCEPVSVPGSNAHHVCTYEGKPAPITGLASRPPLTCGG